jgi:hypothetical protein
MKRPPLALSVILGFVALSLTSCRQQQPPAKVYRIGWLGNTPPAATDTTLQRCPIKGGPYWQQAGSSAGIRSGRWKSAPLPSKPCGTSRSAWPHRRARSPPHDPRDSRRRGHPAADVDALAGALARLSAFAARHADELESIDVNPFIVRSSGQGAVAVDAVVVTRG